jgi:predicted oxidoreductase (fatty acid repression mutant protein)
MKQRELILKLHKYTDRLGRRDQTAAAMISLVVWNAIAAMGQEAALNWISNQVNDSAKSAVKIRKRKKLPI